MKNIRSRGLGRPCLIIACLSLILVACGPAGSSETTSSITVTTSEPGTTTMATPTTEATTTSAVALPVIGFSFGAEDAGIYPIVLAPAQVEAAVRGYELIEGAAFGDCDKQLQDIENFISVGVVGITFLPRCGTQAYTTVVQQAKDAGIIVVGYSQPLPGGDAAIIYDTVRGAADLAAEAIRWYEEDFTGDKATFTWAMTTLDQCGLACTSKTDTLRPILTEAFGKPPLEAEGSNEQMGLEVTETFLQAEPNLNMMIGLNDSTGLGAYQAFVQHVEASGRDPGEIFVAGYDGQKEALELISDGGGVGGMYRVSMALPLERIGAAVVDLVANLFEGQPATGVAVPYKLVNTAEGAQEFLDAYTDFIGG